MVAEYMATALGISPDRSIVYFTYPSEPALAAGALAYYGTEVRWAKDIHWLAKALSEGIADSGECGEAVARIALVRAMHIGFINKVTERLLAIVKADNKEHLCVDSSGEAEFYQGQVAFNHFLSPYCNSADGPALSDRDPNEVFLSAC
ncbi:uncharacterized protein VTP21DRAFT_2104 [Calcarisporiella thermophila]|uniref:uncharacterized protein n=1 Tax=Calcarisporiella thermophila TaxID=911321 RepID=UPI0037442BC5